MLSTLQDRSFAHLYATRDKRHMAMCVMSFGVDMCIRSPNIQHMDTDTC